MSKLQEAAQALKKLEFEAQEERRAMQLKRDFAHFDEPSVLERTLAHLEGETIKRRQALLETEEDRIWDEERARSYASFGKQPPPFHSPSIFISKKGSY